MNAHLPINTRREGEDDYGPVIVTSERGFRVIECRDRIQWIVQRSKKPRTRSEWRGFGYYRTSEALKRSWTGLTGETTPVALTNLPERIGGSAR